MPGIIDYIKWRGDLDFTQSPLNPVDNLIFSELSYMRFDDFLKGQTEMTLQEVAEVYFEKNSLKNLGVLLTGDFRILLEAMSQCRRYRNLIIRDSVDVFDEIQEVQFAATLIELDRQTAYIAFRGTDDTLIGWKEDFQMSFMDEVPAQRMALQYVNNAVTHHRYKKVYIGGHSKGGNLAVYASVHSDEKIKKRIIRVFNNDGPGFKKKIVNKEEYQTIAERIITLVPQSSVVGMLLEHEESYQVVKSTQQGLLQHDGFSWEVSGPEFIYLSEVDDDSITIDRTLKDILNSLSDEQRKAYTNAFFEIISVNDSRTLTDLEENGLKTFFAISKNYRNLDKKTKKAVFQTIYMFFDRGIQNFLEVKNIDQWWENLISGKEKN